jgi:hypothetical protein
MAVIVQHDEMCPPRNRTTLGGHSDAAKRIADEYSLHRTAGGLDNVGQWIACRLSDGSSDHVLYATRREAVRHQKHNEQQFVFLQMRPCGMSVCEAASFLRFARMAYDAGFRLTDPEHRAGGRQIIPRLTREDHARMETALSRRLWIPGRSL